MIFEFCFQYLNNAGLLKVEFSFLYGPIQESSLHRAPNPVGFRKLNRKSYFNSIVFLFIN